MRLSHALAALVAALALALAVSFGPASAAGVLERMDAAARAPRRFTTLAELVGEMAKRDNLLNWNQKQGNWKDGRPMQVLRSMFALAVAQPNIADNAYQPLASTANLQTALRALKTSKNQKHFSRHVVDNAQLTFFQTLRPLFKHSTRARPTVLVYGEGPSGLSAAIHARLKGAAHVTVRGKRPRYYRQHVVSTWASKRIGAGNQGMSFDNGIEQLLEQTLGISANRNPANENRAVLSQTRPAMQAVTAAFAAAFRWEDGSSILNLPPPRGQAGPVQAVPIISRNIKICDLERMLFFIANVVGVEFHFTDAYHGQGAARQRILDTAANPQTNLLQLPQVGAQNLGCPAYAHAVPQQPGGFAHHGADLIIGADGAASGFRAQHFRNEVFEPPSLLQNDAATYIAKGGVVTAAFVFRNNWITNANQNQSPCRKNNGNQNNQNQGRLFLQNPPAGNVNAPVPNNHGIRVLNYVSQFHADSTCQVEIEFKTEAGRALLHQFHAPAHNPTCDESFNYNVLSSSPTGPADVQKLVLLRQILEQVVDATAFPANQDMQSLLASTVEFKVWQNNLRMAMATPQNNNVNANIPAALHTVANQNAKLYVIVGDAARDALPNSGMGVNDGHAMGHYVATLIPTFNTNTNSWVLGQGTAATGILDALSQRETNLVLRIHSMNANNIAPDIFFGTGQTQNGAQQDLNIAHGVLAR